MLSQLLRWITLASIFIAGYAHAISANEVKGIAIGETDARIEALHKAMLIADDKTAAFLQALSDDAVKTSGDKAYIVKDDKAIDPATRKCLCRPMPKM